MINLNQGLPQPISDNLNSPTSSPLPSISPMSILYVSPRGSAQGNGSLENPFNSIYTAQQYVRSINGNMTGPIIIYLLDGTYYLNNTLTLGPEDSGSNGYDIIYRAYPGTTPILHGGTFITNWTQYSQINSNGTLTIWKAKSPIGDFRQLYVNGTRQIRARGAPTMIEGSDGDGHTLNDLSITHWKNLRDVEIVYKAIWKLRRIKIDFYYEPRHRLYMQQPAYGWARSKGGSIIDEPTWIENAFELLDEPGEFYLDKSDGSIYYIPQKSENPNNDVIVVPKVETLVNISGTFSDKVHNIRFEGVSFRYSTWLKPNEDGTCFVDQQANVYLDYENGECVSKMSPGAVYVENSTNIAFENCTFLHLGSGGLDLRGGVDNTLVQGNVFNDISGIAIQVGEIFHPDYTPDHPGVVKDIIIKNNYIVNCSQEYMGGPGIFTGYVRNVLITHNTLSNLPYTGISVGWGWSSRQTIMANNTITFNRIYGVMNYMQDGGGIYTLSTQPGTNVSYNVIFDCGWNGLYPDERTNGTTWSYNVVWDTYNSFLDHSMYEESHWNNVFNNYLETYPRYLNVWYPDRDKDQIFGLRPGDEGFPEDIVEQSGVEPSYRHLIPEHEYYWHYRELTPTLSIHKDGTAFYTILSLLLIAQIAVVAMIVRDKYQNIPLGRKTQKNLKQAYNEKGGKSNGA